MKTKAMNLKEFIHHHWKSYGNCAFDLGVTKMTIYNYVTTNPTGILRHTLAVVEKDNIEPLLLFDAVAETLEQINENRPK